MPLINIGKPRVLQKTKIGREVKGIPSIWLKKSGDAVSDNVIIDKYPYFFKYRYANARKDLQKYKDEANTSCKRTFKMTIDELISKQYRTVDEQTMLDISCCTSATGVSMPKTSGQRNIITVPVQVMRNAPRAIQILPSRFALSISPAPTDRPTSAAAAFAMP